MRFALTTLAATLLLSTNAMAVDAEFHPSTYTTYKKHGPNQGNVEVLVKRPSDERSYTEIGMVRISTDRVSDFYTAVAELKLQAAKHGGNAIILEDDAKIFAAGGTTNSGSKPRNATATAVIQH